MAFSGSKPTMQWFRGDELVDSVDSFDVGRALKSLSIHATHHEDHVTYTCNVMIDDVSNSCSLTLNVTHLVHDLRIIPDKEKLRPGDEFRCSAKGNPEPVVRMKIFVVDSQAPEMTSNPSSRVVRVENAWSGKNITVMCAASNTANDESETITKNHSYYIAAHKRHPTTTTPADDEIEDEDEESHEDMPGDRELADKSHNNNNDHRVVSGVENVKSDPNSAVSGRSSFQRYLTLSLMIVFLSTVL